MVPHLTRFDPPHSPGGMRFTINGDEVPFEVDFANGIIYYVADHNDYVVGCFSGEYNTTGGSLTQTKPSVKKECKPSQNYLNLRKEKW